MVYQNNYLLTDECLAILVPELVFVLMIVFASKGIMECSRAKGFKVTKVQEWRKVVGELAHRTDDDVVNMKN